MAFNWKDAATGGGLLAGLGTGLGSLFSGGGEEWDTVERLLRDLPVQDRETLLNEAQAGPSAFEGITADPTGSGAQNDALAALQAIGNTGGMRTQDRVAVDQAMNRTAQQEQGQRGAIAQNFAARGRGGGGAELAAQIANQQGAANRNAMAGAQAAGNADQRALQAIGQYGDLGSRMRTQGYAEQTAKAGGQDAMARFNAGQRMDAEGMAYGQAANQANSLAGYYSGKAKRKEQQGSAIGNTIGGLVGGITSGFGLF